MRLPGSVLALKSGALVGVPGSSSLVVLDRGLAEGLPAVGQVAASQLGAVPNLHAGLRDVEGPHLRTGGVGLHADRHRRGRHEGAVVDHRAVDDLLGAVGLELAVGDARVQGGLALDGVGLVAVGGGDLDDLPQAGVVGVAVQDVDDRSLVVVGVRGRHRRWWPGRGPSRPGRSSPCAGWHRQVVAPGWDRGRFRRRACGTGPCAPRRSASRTWDGHRRRRRSTSG